MFSIILASQSPRRKELLTQMGVVFSIVPSNYDEVLDDSRPPTEVAIELALGKALEVAERYPDALVIGSDTIVSLDNSQLAKPADSNEARAMLSRLAGKTNVVTTSVAIVCKAKNIEITGADNTEVCFKPLHQESMDSYIATGDPFDKAGGYGIQSGAAILIDSINGNYDTVVGLPTKLLTELLQSLGVSCVPVVLVSPVKASTP